MAGSHSALTKLTGADGPICYFFSLTFVQYSIPCPGWTKEKSSCVLLSETNLQKARESGVLRPCPLTSAASWNAASSPGRHCELLYDGLYPGKGFSWLRQKSSGSSGLCVGWYQGGSLKHGLDKYL